MAKKQKAKGDDGMPKGFEIVREELDRRSGMKTITMKGPDGEFEVKVTKRKR